MHFCPGTRATDGFENDDASEHAHTHNMFIAHYIVNTFFFFTIHAQVNSLINFETVKFFGMERTEAQQLQSNVLTYNKASWKNETSLYALNSAQQGVIAAGGLACMYYSGREVVAGSS